jgi:transposase
VVVLDNAGLHTGGAVRGQRRQLAREGIFLYFLPPYSPELNAIEPVLRLVKDDMPRRSYTSKGDHRVGSNRGSGAGANSSRQNVQLNRGRLLRVPNRR